MKQLIIFLLLSTSALGQDTKDTTILGLKVVPSERWELSTSELIEHSFHDEKGRKIAYRKKDSLPVILDWGKFFYLVEKDPDIKLWVDTCIGKFDLIQVTILVRISGRPWAFFHDGWEVRKVKKLYQSKWTIRGSNTRGQIYIHPDGNYYESSHLLYLDSKKRPIRKEWVVYQTFKR